jgi:fatty acid desaturase
MSDVQAASSQSLQPGQTPGDLFKRFAPAFRPRPVLYWLDMLTSAAVGWALFFLAATSPLGSVVHVLATIGSIFALLRAALFIHELAHFKPGALPHFETVWNLLIGYPIQVPSLMYVGSHMSHHRRDVFGTAQDPEYAPIAHWSRLRIGLFVAYLVFLPLALPIRWGVLSPLSRLFPRLRQWVVGKLSTLVINSDYTRPMPRGEQTARWTRQEMGAGIFAWAIALGFAAGWVPLAFLIQWWLLGAGILVVNQVRTLAAHGYENTGAEMDTENQILDSINLRGWSLLTVLVAPVGLRYHALHHYLPSLPYHSLGVVHRQLLQELPEDAPYRSTLRDGLIVPLKKLWYRGAEPSPVPRPLTESRVARGL